MEEDWDLQAVVRGCKAEGEPSPSLTSRDLFSFPTTFTSSSSTSLHLQEQEGDLLYFPDLSTSKTVLQELHELCEPFLRRRQQPPSPPPPQQQQPQPQPQQRARSPPQPPRSKRRKNQLKKVVCQVPADGASADMWAWRKYGQKPIKGSPFPRGYYRCSSSKGCPARKQVERNRTDPSTFVITYTAEHNHPIPTHRNSLAGSTRHRATTTTAATPKSNAGSPPTQPCSSTEEKKEEEEDEDDSLLLGGDMMADILDDDALMTFVDFDDDRGSPDGFSTVFSSSSWSTPAAAGSG